MTTNGQLTFGSLGIGLRTVAAGGQRLWGDRVERGQWGQRDGEGDRSSHVITMGWGV